MSGAPTPDRSDQSDHGAPWWSSDGVAVDPDQDPLAAHLEARGLHAVDDEEPADEEPGGDEDAAAGGDARPGDDDPTDHAGDPAGAPHPPGICGVCPICRGHALVQERHPEVAGHLADAARSLSRALATFADLVEAEPATRPQRPDRAQRSARADDGFRPITLDDEEGAAR